MKGIRLISLAIACIALGSASLVFAAVSVPSGWYVEGNIGTTRVSNVTYSPGASVTSAGLGGNIDAGYKFIPYFATEIGYSKYADAKIKNPAGTQGATAKNTALDITAKGILPIVNTSVQFFAKLGLAYARSDVSISDATAASTMPGLQTGTHKTASAYLGAGLDYSISPNFPVNFQWQRAQGDNRTGALDLYSVGLAYIFG